MQRRAILVTAAAVVAGIAVVVAVLAGWRSPDVSIPSSPSPTAAPASPTPAGTPSLDGARPSPTPAGGSPTASARVVVSRSEIATGLEAPWAVAFAEDATAYVTERDTGRVLALRDGGTEEIQRLEVDPTGEGGLLGLAAGPDGRHLYAYLSAPAGDNRIVRFLPGQPPEPVLTGIPHGRNHNGGRLVVGPDGMLYAGTGEAGNASLAQDPDSLGGKILRIRPDGSVPDDNPFDGSPVWSLGHRNVQGLAFDADGQLWASEFGPRRDDEINRIEAGANYGWPEVTGRAGRDDFTDPVFVRQPPEASWTGISILTGGAIPQWEGDLFAASLRGERLYRLVLDDGVASSEELLAGELGRLRAAVQAPDGSLWVLTSNRDGRGSPREGDDRIVRLGP